MSLYITVYDVIGLYRNDLANDREINKMSLKELTEIREFRETEIYYCTK